MVPGDKDFVAGFKMLVSNGNSSKFKIQQRMAQMQQDNCHLQLYV